MLSCRRGQEVYKRWIEREREPRRKTYAGIIYCRKMLQEHFPKLKLILMNDSAKVILGGKRHFPLFLSRVFSFLKNKKNSVHFVVCSPLLYTHSKKSKNFMFLLGFGIDFQLIVKRKIFDKKTRTTKLRRRYDTKKKTSEQTFS